MTVYIKEAHPTEDDEAPTERAEGICYGQPNTIVERRAVANDFKERFSYALPLWIDSMDNVLMDAYTGWPERLYVLHEGKVAYKGEPGPKGFDPEGVQAWMDAYVAASDTQSPTKD